MNIRNDLATNMLNSLTADLLQQPLFPELPDQGVRVNRSQLAVIMQVSRSAVSQWVSAGKVEFDADGLIDPARATNQLLRNSDGRRLGSKLLRPLADHIVHLQARNRSLEKQNADLRYRLYGTPHNDGLAA